MSFFVVSPDLDLVLKSYYKSEEYTFWLRGLKVDMNNTPMTIDEVCKIFCLCTCILDVVCSEKWVFVYCKTKQCILHVTLYENYNCCEHRRAAHYSWHRSRLLRFLFVTMILSTRMSSGVTINMDLWLSQSHSIYRAAGQSRFWVRDCVAIRARCSLFVILFPTSTQGVKVSVFIMSNLNL